MKPRTQVVLMCIGAGVLIGAVALAAVLVGVPRWAMRAAGLSIALVCVLSWLWKLGTPKDALPENHHDVVRRINAQQIAQHHGRRRDGLTLAMVEDPADAFDQFEEEQWGDR